MKKFILLAFLLLTLHHLYAQTGEVFPTKLSEWVNYPLPLAYGILEKEGKQQQSDSYLLYTDEDTLKVMRSQEIQNSERGDSIPFSSHVLSKVSSHLLTGSYAKKVNNGFFIGAKYGDFGGNLWWFSNDGREYYRLGETVNYIVEVAGRTLGISSYGRFDMKGKIFDIIQTKSDKWVCGASFELPGTPYCHTILADSCMYIIAGYDLVKFNPTTMECFTVLTCPFDWHFTPPKSIFAYKDDMYIMTTTSIFKISNVIDFAMQLKGSGVRDSKAMWHMEWLKSQ